MELVAGKELHLPKAAGLIAADGPFVIRMGVQNHSLGAALIAEPAAEQADEPPANPPPPQLRHADKLVDAAEPQSLPGRKSCTARLYLREFHDKAMGQKFRQETVEFIEKSAGIDQFPPLGSPQRALGHLSGRDTGEFIDEP